MENTSSRRILFKLEREIEILKCAIIENRFKTVLYEEIR